MSERFWKNFSYIWGFIGIGMLFGLVLFDTNIEIKDLDLWLHLAMGRFIVHNGYVPNVDVLSCSIAGKPWINHEWLFQVLAWVIYNNWGADGLITMQSVVVCITFVLLLLMGYGKDRQFGVTVLLLLILLVYEFRFTIRPDIFSLLFFALYIHILSLFIDRRWSIVALFVIQVLWTNMHGFFFFGPFIVIIGLISEFIKRRVKLPWEWNQVGRLEDPEFLRLKWILVAVVLACFFNPMTFKGAWYPIKVLLSISGENKLFFSYIQELQKPITGWDSLFTPNYSYYKALLFISLVSFIFNRWYIDINSFIFWLFFLGFSLMAVRNLVFFSFVAYFVTLSNFVGIKSEDIVPISFNNRKFFHLTIIVAKIGLIMWMLNYGMGMTNRGYYDFDAYERKSEFGGVTQRGYTDKAVDFLVANKIKGNFLNDFNSGAYLLGRTHPNIKVYIDGRTEVYGADFFNNYLKIFRDGDNDEIEKALETCKITGVLLNSSTRAIPDEILKNFYKRKDWVMVYLDYDGVIFLKDVPLNKKVIDKYRIDLNKWQPPKMDFFRLGTTQVLPYRSMNRAFTLETLGFYDLAIAECQEALRVTPGYIEPYKLLGKIYGKREEHSQAYENFRIATMIEPSDSQNRYNMALALENMGEYGYAIKQYQRLRDKSPNQPKAYFMLARALAKDKQYGVAMQTVKQGLKLDPSASKDVLKIGDVFYDRKEYKVAAQFYVAAINTKNDLATIHHKLGLCALGLGDRKKAMDEFEKGYAIDPEDEDLKKSLREMGRIIPELPSNKTAKSPPPAKTEKLPVKAKKIPVEKATGPAYNTSKF